MTPKTPHEPPIEQTQQQFVGSDPANTPTRQPSNGDVPLTLPSSGSMPESPDIAPPGFEILGVLGRGGMGVVYHARQSKLNREVALKMILSGGHSSADDRTRFLAEAESIAALNHPGIVQVYEFGTHAGQPYFALEYCPGGSLAKQLNGTPLPPKDAASLVQKLAYAVHAAHEKGIVHRDLKPANVLLTAIAHDAKAAEKQPETAFTAGYSAISSIKVTDFGLAKRIESGPDLTKTGAIMGTPSYMAPEQAMGRGKQIGPAADVYALGAILYELLTGRPPFKADNAFDTMLQVVNDDPVSIRQLQKKVPTDLETICHKCLHKDSQRRYASAKELARDLGRWLGGEAILARPAGWIEKAIKWARRRPAVAALCAAIAALIALAIGSVIFYQREQIIQQRQRESSERQARAAATVDAMQTADIASVPLIIRALQRLRAEADPLLHERHAAAKPGSPERLRYALALLPSDPELAEELLGFVPKAAAGDLFVLREALRPHADKVTALWPRLAVAEGAERLHFAALLAGYLPADDRWQPYAAGLVDQLVELNPLELAGWSPAFDRIHRPLIPPLLDLYAKTQTQLKGGELDVQELVGSAAQFDLAATLLARYAADQPEILANVLQTADARHFAAFLAPARGLREKIAPALLTVVEAMPKDGASDEEIRALCVRQAHAAATLSRLGEPQPAWRVFAFNPAQNSDPTARSYLIEGMAQRGIDPLTLIRQYDQEQDVSARRALLLALGEFDPAKLPPAERQRLTDRLLGDFREHPDAGLHGAIDWLLRQKWGQAIHLDQITTELRKKPGGERSWFINGEGQTFTIIRGPVTFTMGSPPDEPGRDAGNYEKQHQKTIPRTFAIATREVTVAEYLKFRVGFDYRKQWAPSERGPINDTSWYEAAAYCNWLSQQEGIPEAEWCYPKEIKPGMEISEDFLKRTGYRLPTESEWEYACRAGAITARPSGRDTDWLGQYSWYRKNSRDHLWPCGQLKPNDLGLFDTLGNVLEWCQERLLFAFDGRADDREQTLTIANNQYRILRGGSFLDKDRDLRSANRYWERPDSRKSNVGFRPARTYR